MSIVFATNRRGQPKLPTLMKGDARDIFKQTFTLALPVALGAFVMQMSQVIDSVMVVNLLSVANETSLYGLWTGPVNSMLGLPIALSAGVAVSALPSITRTFVTNDREKLNSSFNSAFKLTIVIGTPCAFGMIMLSRPIISLLYGGLAAEEIHVAGLLLAISGLSILFLSIMQTSVSVLQAVGKPYVSVYIIAGAIVVKAVVNLLLLPIDSINIYGAALSETLCYLFSTVCVMIYLSTKLKLKIQLSETVLKPVAASLIMTLGLTLLITFAENFVATKIGTLMSIGIAGLLYLASLWVLRVFSEAELNLLPKRRREVS
jgi:stage V sporulation protein B